MARWSVQQHTRRFAGPGPNAADVSHGVNVYLRDATGQERKIAVWYATGANERVLRPKEAVRRYLDDALPPDHLIVDWEEHVRRVGGIE